MGVKRRKPRRADGSQVAAAPGSGTLENDPLAGTALPNDPADDEPDAATSEEVRQGEHVEESSESLAAQCQFDEDDASDGEDRAEETNAEQQDLSQETGETHVAPGCPDADRINAAEWPRRDAPPTSAARERRYQVLFQPGVLDEIHRHGKSNTEVELCGVLVGNVYHDGAAPYVLIEASIRGNAAVSKGTQVTFTSETWTRIHEALERDHPDCRIVGWYHTHPGFGIFLSGMDLFIQDNFFNAPWQVAFVYDPIGGDEGVFIWRAGRSLREPHLVVARDDAPPAGWMHRGVDWLRGWFASS